MQKTQATSPQAGNDKSAGDNGAPVYEPQPDDRDRYEIIVNRELDDDYRRGNL